METFINTFDGGWVTDLAPDKVPSNMYIDANNIEIFNRDGKGLVAVPMKGTTHQFSLSKGYHAIKTIVYKNLVFIFSIHQDTGYCEIGTFPSLKSYNIVSGEVEYTSESGLELLYKPIINYSGSGTISKVKPLRTPGLLLYDHSRIKGFAKEDCDGKIFLYYTDGEQPIKRIDTGIKSDYTLSGSTYTEDQIKENTNLFVTRAHGIDISVNNVLGGGNLQYGGYYYFVRYVTDSFERTNILDSSEMCPVYKGDGTFDGTEGGNTYLTNENSSKKIELKLNNLDTNYAYFEIIQLRYHGDVEGVPDFELNLIDKRYAINSDSATIQVTGYEQLQTFTLAELLAVDAKDIIAKSILDHDNRLWGVRWKSRNPHNDLLKTFATKLVPTVITKYIDEYAYSNWEYVTKYKGYFRYEAYPFAAHFIFNDGTKSPDYPVQGYDFLKDTIASNGAIRFPSVRDYPLGGFQTSNVSVLGLKFTFDKSWYDALTDIEKEWLSTNIKGIKITRGERIVNFVYEGYGVNMYGRNNQNIISTGVYKPFNINPELGTYVINDIVKSNGVSIPMMDIEDEHMPVMQQGWTYPGMIGECDGECPRRYIAFITSEYDQTEYERKLLAIFSPDFLFRKATEDHNINHVLGSETLAYYESNKPGSLTYINPNIEPSTLISHFRSTYVANIDSFTVKGWEKVGEDYIADPVNKSSKYGCVNRAFDYTCTPNDNQRDTDKPYSLFYSIDKTSYINGSEWIYDSLSNRNLYVPKYLVLEHESNLNQIGYKTFTLFKQNPDTIDVNDLIDPVNTEYFELTKLMELSEFLNDPITVYGGDCYVQRSVIKIMSWEPSDTLVWDFIQNEWSPIDNDIHSHTGQGHNISYHIEPTYYHHGRIISFVSQNVVNTGFREEGDNNTYWPKVKQRLPEFPQKYSYLPWSDSFTYEGNNINVPGIESFIYNIGYSFNSPLRIQYGYNELTKREGEWIESKTRLRCTAKDIPGSIYDNYRVQPLSSYRDFDLSKGAMNDLQVIRGYMISAQEDTINQHYINEKGIRTPSSEGDLIIGITDIIAEYVKTLSDFGSEDIILSDRAVYGFDIKRRIPWRSSYNVSKEGRSFLGVEDLAKTKLVSEGFKSLTEANVSPIDVFYNDYVNHKQVTINFDKEKSYLYFTFHNPTTTADNGSSIIFDEDNDKFLGKSSLKPYLMFTINQEFTYNCSAYGRNSFHRANHGLPLDFYGTTKRFSVKSVINGLLEQSNTSHIDKIYNSGSINMPNVNPLYIHYETMKQQAVLYPWISNNMWEVPEYQDSEWFFPIPKQLNVIVDEYDRGSEMRGMWMTQDLVIKTNYDFFISDTKTNFSINLIH